MSTMTFAAEFMVNPSRLDGAEITVRLDKFGQIVEAYTWIDENVPEVYVAGLHEGDQSGECLLLTDTFVAEFGPELLGLVRDQAREADQQAEDRFLDCSGEYELDYEYER